MKMAQTKQLATERPEVQIPKVAVASSWQPSHLIGLFSKVFKCLVTLTPQKSKITFLFFSFNAWYVVYMWCIGTSVLRYELA